MDGRTGELVTERLILRPPAPQDLSPFVRLCADPEVMRHIGACRPVDRGAAELGFAVVQERWRRDGTGLFTAVERDTGEYLGFVGTAPVPAGAVRAGATEIGWRLARPAWGRGLATEGARAVAVHVAAVHAICELVALIRPENERSRRVAVKLGLHEAGEGRGARGELVVVYAGAVRR